MTCDELDSYILEGWAHAALSGRVHRALIHPQKYLAHHRALRDAGDRLAHRAERVRNGVVHGNPADDEVVSSIYGLSRYRAYVSLEVALESITRGVPMAQELERRRSLTNARLAALQNGKRLVDHLSGTA